MDASPLFNRNGTANLAEAQPESRGTHRRNPTGVLISSAFLLIASMLSGCTASYIYRGDQTGEVRYADGARTEFGNQVKLDSTASGLVLKRQASLYRVPTHVEHQLVEKSTGYNPFTDVLWEPVVFAFQFPVDLLKFINPLDESSKDFHCRYHNSVHQGNRGEEYLRLLLPGISADEPDENRVLGETVWQEVNSSEQKVKSRFVAIDDMAIWLAYSAQPLHLDTLDRNARSTVLESLAGHVFTATEAEGALRLDLDEATAKELLKDPAFAALHAKLLHRFIAKGELSRTVKVGKLFHELGSPESREVHRHLMSAYMARARSSLQTGKLNAAITDLETLKKHKVAGASEVASQIAQALVARGLEARHEKRWSDAITDLGLARGLDSVIARAYAEVHADVLASRGRIYLDRGSYGSAKQDLAAASRLSTGHQRELAAELALAEEAHAGQLAYDRKLKEFRRKQEEAEDELADQTRRLAQQKRDQEKRLLAQQREEQRRHAKAMRDQTLRDSMNRFRDTIHGAVRNIEESNRIVASELDNHYQRQARASGSNSNHAQQRQQMTREYNQQRQEFDRKYEQRQQQILEQKRQQEQAMAAWKRDMEQRRNKIKEHRRLLGHDRRQVTQQPSLDPRNPSSSTHQAPTTSDWSEWKGALPNVPLHTEWRYRLVTDGVEIEVRSRQVYDQRCHLRFRARPASRGTAETSPLFQFDLDSGETHSFHWRSPLKGAGIRLVEAVLAGEDVKIVKVK